MSSLSFPLPEGFSSVANADVPPGRRICCLLIESSSGLELATGWMFGTHTVVTARHAFDGVGSAKIHVLPGRNGPNAGFFGHFITDLFERAPLSLGDFAAVFVREPLGGSIGAFQLPLTPPASLGGARIVLSGYRRGDDGQGQLIGRGEVRDDFGSLIRYTLNTVKGMSGSPIWIDGDDTNVVAIHTDPSVAMKITANVANHLNSWLQVEGTRVSAPGMVAASSLALRAPAFVAGRSVAAASAAARAPAMPAAAMASIESIASTMQPTTIQPDQPGAAFALKEREFVATRACSDLGPVARMAESIAAMVVRTQPGVRRIAVQVRKQTARWEAQALVPGLSLEEQSMVTVLSSRLPEVAVSCPQMLGTRAAVVPPPSRPARKKSAASTRGTATSDDAILDIALCVSANDDVIGVATLMTRDGVVFAGETWPVSANQTLSEAAAASTSNDMPAPKRKRPKPAL